MFKGHCSKEGLLFVRDFIAVPYKAIISKFIVSQANFSIKPCTALLMTFVPSISPQEMAQEQFKKRGGKAQESSKSQWFASLACFFEAGCIWLRLRLKTFSFGLSFRLNNVIRVSTMHTHVIECFRRVVGGLHFIGTG